MPRSTSAPTPRIIKRAQQGSTQIRAVPTLIIFFDGRPFAIYKGQKTPDEIKNFLASMAETYAAKHAERSDALQRHEQQRLAVQQGQHAPSASIRPPPRAQMGPPPGPSRPPMGMGPGQSGINPPPRRPTAPQAPPQRGGHRLLESEEEEDTTLWGPADVTPYNQPWLSQYAQME